VPPGGRLHLRPAPHPSAPSHLNTVVRAQGRVATMFPPIRAQPRPPRVDQRSGPSELTPIVEWRPDARPRPELRSRRPPATWRSRGCPDQQSTVHSAPSPYPPNDSPEETV
jgi:hypothetical protein